MNVMQCNKSWNIIYYITWKIKYNNEKATKLGKKNIYII